MIKKELLELCESDEYESECPIYEAGNEWREMKGLEKLAIHCPFASNDRCGHPEIWTCKGSNYPFIIYPAYLTETWLQKLWRQILTFIHIKEPLDTYEGKPIEFSKSLIEVSCWSGDKEIYMKCLHYVDGLKAIEDYYELRPHLKPGFKSNESP
jgi:hypothetical protein